MKYNLLLLLACLAMVSCAPSIKRIGYRETKNPPLLSEPQILYTDIGLNRKNCLETMIIDGYNTISSFSHDDALKIIKKECYRISANTAYLYKMSMNNSGFFGGQKHFKAYVDFYVNDAKPINKIDQDSLRANE